MYVFFAKPTLTEITFPCFYFWFKFIKGLSVSLREMILDTSLFQFLIWQFSYFLYKFVENFLCLSFSETEENSLLVVLYCLQFWALLHFCTPLLLLMTPSWKNAAESFTVALTLTLGGYESAIVPNFVCFCH